jgi:hypothetical protein
MLRVWRYEAIRRDTSSCDRMDCVALISKGSMPHERMDAKAMVVLPIPGGPWSSTTFECGFVDR